MTTGTISKQTVTLRPLANRIALRPIKEPEQTRGGLHIPALAKDTPQQGEVVAVGPGRYVKGERIPMELTVGQTVLFGKYDGTEVTVDNEKYVIIEETEVLAVIGE